MMRMILSLILFMSGITQVMDPYFLVNYLPTIVPAKLDFIFFHALINIILSVLIFMRKLRKYVLAVIAWDVLIIVLIYFYNFIR